VLAEAVGTGIGFAVAVDVDVDVAAVVVADDNDDGKGATPCWQIAAVHLQYICSVLEPRIRRERRNWEKMAAGPALLLGQRKRAPLVAANDLLEWCHFGQAYPRMTGPGADSSSFPMRATVWQEIAAI
jgi:hypothetical protein